MHLIGFCLLPVKCQGRIFFQKKVLFGLSRVLTSESPCATSLISKVLSVEVIDVSLCM